MLTGLELNKRLEHVKPAPEELGRLGHNASALHAPAVLFPTICRLMELDSCREVKVDFGFFRRAFLQTFL